MRTLTAVLVLFLPLAATAISSETLGHDLRHSNRRPSKVLLQRLRTPAAQRQATSAEPLWVLTSALLRSSPRCLCGALLAVSAMRR